MRDAVSDERRDRNGPSVLGCTAGLGYLVAVVLAGLWIAAAITLRAPAGFVALGVVVFALGALALYFVQRLRR